MTNPSSPAEAYAAFKARQVEAPVDVFEAGLAFPLDAYQRQACAGLLAGESVLVAAPTGAGKTVVGWFGIDLMQHSGRRAFYTTPIKALSNQKFRELGERYGVDQVGLLTGDQTVRPEAPIVVMTTEVLRNMLYGRTGLQSLGLVVLDEVHYLADRFRGPVWEEVLIQLPASVQVAALSATVSNAEEFGEWLAQVRGAVRVVVSDVRPVPLWQHMLVPEGLKDLYSPLASGEQSTNLNPELMVPSWAAAKGSGSAPGRGYRGPQRGRRSSSRGGAASGRGPRARTTPRFAVVEALNREGLLPAIFFVFSRAGCEAAADQCRQAGLALTTPAQSARIDAVLERRALALPTGDLGVVGYHEFADQARAGFAPHHAGMLPLFKEAVEELFQEGLLKVVFATETLSLGINMPARTVVMDRLDKWDGTAHTDLTPGEYTQLTGRAGRRGIDVEGHAVVVAGPRVNAAQVAPLASKRTYPLRSAFHATYNMAVNLTARLGPDPARQTLGLSFAQFQADRSVAGLAGQIRQLDQAIDGYEQAMSCDQGDFREFQQLRDRLSKLEKQAAQSKIQARRAQTRAVLSQLKRGDVLRASSGRGGGLMLVIHPGKTGQGRPLVLTEQGKVRRVVLSETGTGLNLVGHIKLAGQDTAKTTQQRDGLVHRMLAVANEAPPSDGAATVVSSPTEPTGPQLQDQIKDLRAELRSHPVASCPDREAHARWSRRWTKTITQRERLVRSMENRTGSLVRQFDRISAVLGELGYLDGGEVTSAGRILARIYAERDLTIAECVRQGIWESLAAPDLAAALTALVYEPRTEVPPVPEPLNGVVRQTIAKQQRIWEQIRSLELHHGVPASPGVAPAASALVGRWAAGQGLADTLRGGLLSPGDFVRLVSRVVDVLDHIRSVAPTEGLYRAAESAIRQLRRGVVVFEQA